MSYVKLYPHATRSLFVRAGHAPQPTLGALALGGARVAPCFPRNGGLGAVAGSRSCCKRSRCSAIGLALVGNRLGEERGEFFSDLVRLPNHEMAAGFEADEARARDTAASPLDRLV